MERAKAETAKRTKEAASRRQREEECEDRELRWGDRDRAVCTLGMGHSRGV